MQPSSQSNAAATSPPVADAIAAAIGRIPSGLFVASWRDGDADRCMLASWVMQAGFAPPAVSIAVSNGRDLLTAVDRGQPFALSGLSESQRSLLARFGKPTADAFAGLPLLRTAGGCAVLAEAACWLECRPAAQAAYGDHVVLVAEVLAGGGTGDAPLVHVRRNGLRY